jgi:hypothetical protein
LVPGKKVVWHVTDAKLNFVKNKTEWNGTEVVFEITKQGGKTELRFTPVGLVPALKWYGDCSGAWGFYINDSLQSLVTKDKGQAARKEKWLGKRVKVFRFALSKCPLFTRQPYRGGLTVKLATEEVNDVSILFGNHGIGRRRRGFYRRVGGIGC